MAHRSRFCPTRLDSGAESDAAEPVCALGWIINTANGPIKGSAISGERVDDSHDADTHDNDAADDAHLRASLAGLAGLAAGGESLEAMLTQVATLACRAIPGADGAGITVFQQDRRDTLAASTPFVREVDDAQYGLGQGPCITASTEGRTIRSGSLATDRSWPRFGSQAGKLGVHSALSVPLSSPERVLGSLNVYARARDAFDDRAQDLGELFAAPAADSVRNAQELSQAQRLAGQLQTAMDTRGVIDQARGILMARTGCSEDEAFGKLRKISQGENRRMSVVARSIVDEAVRRARSRPTGT